MYCSDCGKRISQGEFVENDGLCIACFEEMIIEVMEDEDGKE